MKVKIKASYNPSELPKGVSVKKMDNLLQTHILVMGNYEFHTEFINTDGIRTISFDLEVINEPLLRFNR